MTRWNQESSQNDFSASSSALNSPPPPAVVCLPFRIRAIPPQVLRASLFSHLLSEDGINKSMNPAPTGLWCPPASYFSSFQSTATLNCWNTPMRRAAPWRMFINSFSDERRGSAADGGDSCIRARSLLKISTSVDLCILFR